MKKVFTLLPLAVVCATQFAHAATDAERLAQVEQKLAMLQEQNEYDSLAERMSINGFFTGKMVAANNDAGFESATTNPNFADGSKLGLQGTFSISDQTQVVAQIVGRGSDDWTPEMEWAFLSHDFDNGFLARVGRLRLPLYMYSDFLEVGYAQPWATPPADVYTIAPISSFNGVDVTYQRDVGDTTLALQVSYGNDSSSGEDNSVGKDVDFSDIAGLSATLSYEEWVFRGTYFQTDLNSKDTGLPLLGAFEKNKAQFVGAGISYDNGSLVAISEYTISKVEGTYADTESAYITLGYRLEAFTPYVSYSYLKTTDDEKRVGSPPDMALLNWQRTTYSAGTRYDISANLALKLDVTYAGDFGGTSGALTSNIDSKTYANTKEFDDTIVYTVSFDAVF
ncbi:MULTISPECIES: porin [unclassified Moritella]|uniref:porin n=1 Tax=unclassified Moritella TaxID=2637987 RepID=UPI001BAC5B80|nr:MULTISPECIES: porin [unclassified Moritella]QUM83384.1 porin [Moritella sp. 28]QUM87686.1 porin [Moritella sp. 36]